MTAVVSRRVRGCLSRTCGSAVHVLARGVRMLRTVTRTLLRIRAVGRGRIRGLFGCRSVCTPKRRPGRRRSRFSPPPVSSKCKLPSFAGWFSSGELKRDSNLFDTVGGVEGVRYRLGEK